MLNVHIIVLLVIHLRSLITVYYLFHGVTPITDVDGNNRMRFYYSKDSKAYRLKQVYKTKVYEFRQEIIDRVLEEAVKPTERKPGVSITLPVKSVKSA